jgi:hypothetical protein
VAIHKIQGLALADPEAMILELMVLWEKNQAVVVEAVDRGVLEVRVSKTF